MKTTLILNDELAERLQRLADRSARPLPELIQDVLLWDTVRRERPLVTGKPLRGRVKRIEGEPVNLTTFRGNGLQSGVNLDHSAGLRDLMDAADAAP